MGLGARLGAHAHGVGRMHFLAGISVMEGLMAGNGMGGFTACALGPSGCRAGHQAAAFNSLQLPLERESASCRGVGRGLLCATVTPVTPPDPVPTGVAAVTIPWSYMKKVCGGVGGPFCGGWWPFVLNAQLGMRNTNGTARVWWVLPVCPCACVCGRCRWPAVQPAVLFSSVP